MDSLVVVGVKGEGEHAGRVVVGGFVPGLTLGDGTVLLSGLRILGTLSADGTVCIVHNLGLGTAIRILCAVRILLNRTLTVHLRILRTVVGLNGSGLRIADVLRAVIVLVVLAVIPVVARVVGLCVGTVLLGIAVVHALLSVAAALLLNLTVGAVETFVVEVRVRAAGFAATEDVFLHQFRGVVIEHGDDEEEYDY